MNGGRQTKKYVNIKSAVLTKAQNTEPGKVNYPEPWEEPEIPCSYLPSRPASIDLHRSSHYFLGGRRLELRRGTQGLPGRVPWTCSLPSKSSWPTSGCCSTSLPSIF